MTGKGLMEMRMIRRRRSPVAERSTLCPRDLMTETVAGVAQRPGRTALTMLGTVLGTGAFVAVLGLTATASGQIGAEFSVLKATTVTVNDVGSPNEDGTVYDFPPDADARVGALHGVVHAGVWWPVDLSDPVIATMPYVAAGSDSDDGNLPLYAASAGALLAMQPAIQSGELFNDFDISNDEPVVVLGPVAASTMSISNLTAQPAIFINGIAFTVVGIISRDQRVPDVLSGLIIPSTTAIRDFGLPSSNGPAQMVIWTRLGAADQVAAEAPLALRPDAPKVLQSVAPPDQWAIQGGVNQTLEELFLALAGVSLIIGAVGIANTTLVAVLERTGEFGLRRSLGAQPRHITIQVLAEAGATGFLGGLIGSGASVLIIVIVALSRHWTAIVDPPVVFAAPFAGMLAGLLAGLYPAFRASRIEPLEALRS
jgi:putative ABC transport system permease protein